MKTLFIQNIHSESPAMANLLSDIFVHHDVIIRVTVIQLNQHPRSNHTSNSHQVFPEICRKSVVVDEFVIFRS